MPYLTPCSTGVYLDVRIQPGASRNAIEGPELDEKGQEYLKIRLTAPPLDGKANEALLLFLARQWKYRTSAFSLLKGQTSRRKRLFIEGDTEVLMEVIRKGVEGR